MEYILKRVKKENFKDLKAEGIYNLDNFIPYALESNIDITKTNLFNYLNTLNLEELKQLTVYILCGREMSKFYGTVLKIPLKEYYEYFRQGDLIVNSNKEQLIKYICSFRVKLSNYIDATLRNFKGGLKWI